MGQKFYYFSKEPVSGEKLQKLKENASNFKGFRSTESGKAIPCSFHLNPNHLPPLKSKTNTDIRTIHITGKFKNDTYPGETFKDILTKGESSIGRIGHLLVKGGSYMISCRDDTRNFALLPSNRRRPKEQNILNTWVRRTIEIADLPIDIVKIDDQLKLIHQLNDYLHPKIIKLTPSFNFRCEVSNRSLDDMVDAMGRCIAELEPHKKISPEWTVCTVLNNRNWDQFTENLQLYEYVCQYKFPADSYDFRLDIRLATWKYLEDYLELFSSNDKCYIGFCSFNLPDRNYANIEVTARQSGLFLEMETRVPVNISELNKKLGVAFYPRKH